MSMLDEIMEALESYYVRTKGDEVWYKCPFHEDDHASMHINVTKELWFCHACQPRGGEGTLRSLYRKLQEIGMLPEKPQVNYDDETVSTFTQLINLWHRKLLQNTELLDYLQRQRALSLDIIKAAKLGLANLPTNGKPRWLLTIPIPDENGNFVAVKVRRLMQNGTLTFSSEHPKYFWLTSKDHPLIPDVSKPSVYPYHLASHYVKLVLVGGELDALASFSVGVPAIASTKGETYVSDELLEFVRYKTVIVALDNEPEVIEKIDDVIDALDKRAFAVMRANYNLYHNCKDVTDLVRENRYRDVLNNPIIPEVSHSKRIFVYRDENGFWTLDRNNNPVLITPLDIQPIAFYYRYESEPIMALGSDFDKQMSSAHIHVRITTPPSHGSVTKDLFLDLGAFSDARRLHILLENAGLVPGIFTKKSELTDAILHSFNAPVINYSHRIGLHYTPNKEFFYLFPGYSIPDINIRYLDIYGVGFWQFKFVDVSDDEILKIINNLMDLHQSAVIIKILAMLHATAVAPYVRSKLAGVFPVVYVYGPKGCGKTTLITNVFQPMLGEIGQVTLALGQTESTLRKYADARLSVPLVLDEFTPGRHREEDLQNARNLIHACYNRTVKQVSKSATALERDFVAHAPLWMIGENSNWIAREEALAERIYGIPFSSGPTEKNISVYYEIFSNSDALYGYAKRLYEFIVKNKDKLDNWWELASQVVFQSYMQIERRNVTERIMLMWKVAVFGWIIAIEFWKSVGWESSKLKLDNLDGIAKILFPFEYPKLETDRIVRFLLDLNDINTIDPLTSEDYKYDEDSHLLYIYLPSCAEKVNRWRRGTFAYTSHDLSEIAKGLMRSGSEYIVNVHQVVKLAGKPKRCLVINTDALYRQTGVILSELIPTLGYVTQTSDDTITTTEQTASTPSFNQERLEVEVNYSVANSMDNTPDDTISTIDIDDLDDEFPF